MAKASSTSRGVLRHVGATICVPKGVRMVHFWNIERETVRRAVTAPPLRKHRKVVYQPTSQAAIFNIATNRTQKGTQSPHEIATAPSSSATAPNTRPAATWDGTARSPRRVLGLPCGPLPPLVLACCCASGSSFVATVLRHFIPAAQNPIIAHGALAPLRWRPPATAAAQIRTS